MDDKNPQTGADTPPAGTGSEDKNPTPPATQSPAQPIPATDDDDKVVLSKKDYQNLVSARDKATNGNKEFREQLAETDSILNAVLQKDAVRDAMAKSDFKEKYPDVTEAELLEANPTNDEMIEKIAEAKQKRYEEVKLSAIKKVQVAEAPTIAPADRATKLKELAGPNKPKGAFQQALSLSRMRVK
jgi:hypothetical protein